MSDGQKPARLDGCPRRTAFAKKLHSYACTDFENRSRTFGFCNFEHIFGKFHQKSALSRDNLAARNIVRDIIYLISLNRISQFCNCAGFRAHASEIVRIARARNVIMAREPFKIMFRVQNISWLVGISAVTISGLSEIAIRAKFCLF